MTVMKSNEHRQVLARACEPDSQDLKAMGTIQELHESMAETKDHDVEPVDTQTVLPTTIEPEHANDGDDVHHAASSSQLDLEDDIGSISTIPVSHTTGPHAALQPASTTEAGSSGLQLLQRTRALLSARTSLTLNNEEETKVRGSLVTVKSTASIKSRFFLGLIYTKVVEVNNQKLDEGRLGHAPLSLASFELFMLLKVVEVNNQKLDEGRLGHAPLSLASFELFMLLVLGISLPIVHW
eukprot:CAMPEP_0119115786 /NCGR_PEP_ID=MMETSP1180-20130426/51930_1 /TAXON_ID=3052 ORGANISM="Chlamydomonas cf sp, Strain CCMP681" /NCGR_SAMPLE_ID=MMETSP1180 /ASSEMBLY_ACC=CAM_ASM_000741 /LENGTH=238 /DNA_ID=CAMNT_0007104877 /DNA_START=345 /DNA_END=1059 /DNA_ORIENTATION=+